jgi:hypothetical protein
VSIPTSQNITVPTSDHSVNSYPQQKPFKAHELNPKEEQELPKEEKEELVTMPIEANSIWQEVIGKNGKPYYKTPVIILKRMTPAFHQMLEAIEPTEFSHIAFGNFCYCLSKDNVIRTNYFKKTALGSTSTSRPAYTPAKPKFIGNVFFGTQDEINDFLNQDENKGKWEAFGDGWKVTADGKVIVGLYKQSIGV